jgi:hypothetical protein
VEDIDVVDIPDPVTPEPIDDTRSGALATVWEEHRYALIALGGLALLAVVLSVAARRRGVLPGGSRSQPGPLEREVQISADWAASLRHLAAACDQRMQGMQQQLDSIFATLGAEGPRVEPSPTVSPNGAANLTYESAISDQPENIPPGPATTGMP